MKKLLKIDYIFLGIIFFLVLLYVLLFTHGFNYMYGSAVDWDCQHFMIPDYFRKLFYDSGNLLPNFAFHLGNGQNIFYFSYYGLLSPFILLSYFFPFIKMAYYIQFMSILIVLLSSFLFYRWVLNKYNSKVAFCSCLLFTFSIPLIFHSHRHIMFISCLPFLILGLYGVDQYFEKKSLSLLIISIFLLAMSNYFFCVSSIVVLTIYGIASFISKNHNITLKKFFIEGFKFSVPILVGLLMSMIVLLPTLGSIFQGRSSSNVSVSLLNLLIPNFKFDSLFYSSYSIGLTGLSFLSLIYGITHGKRWRFLPFMMIVIFASPFIIYLLNGLMYVDYKVTISFLPLVGLVNAFFLNSLFERKISSKFFSFSFILFILILILNKFSNVSFYMVLEFLIIWICYFFIIKKNYIYITFLFIFANCLYCTFIASNDNLYLRKDYNNVIKKYSTDDIFKNDINIYRFVNANDLLRSINYVPNLDYNLGTIYSSLSNPFYKDFYYNYSGNEVTQRSYGKITSSFNILYNLYNANKYMIYNNDDVPAGYSKKSSFYINEDVLPIAYASSNLMSREDFLKLSFPYNLEALLKYVIVDRDVESNFTSKIEPYEGQIKISEGYDFPYSKSDNRISFNLEKTTELYLDIDTLKEKEILFIEFNLENNGRCPNGDLSISINNINNVLTCKSWKYHNKNTNFKYVISSNSNLDKLKVKLSKGNFIISNIKMYKANYDDFRDAKKSVDEFFFSDNKVVSDSFAGHINVKENGYFIATIPYDNGMKIYVDEKKVDVEKVDIDFIGFPVTKGEHTISFEYTSPLFKPGLVLSLIGSSIFFITLFHEKKHKKDYKQLTSKNNKSYNKSK